MRRQQEWNLFCKKESQSIILLETFVSILPSGWLLFSGWPQLQLTHSKCLSQETKANFPGQGSNLDSLIQGEVRQTWSYRASHKTTIIFEEDDGSSTDNGWK